MNISLGLILKDTAKSLTAVQETPKKRALENESV